VVAAVEVGRAEEVGHLDDRVAIDQERAEDGLLGVDGLRWQTIDGHDGSMDEGRRWPAMVRCGGSMMGSIAHR